VPLVQMNKRLCITSKKRILDAASMVFSDYGYARANMRMLASVANISIGGLYLYFKNKEDIYLTLMKTRMDDFFDKAMESVKYIDDPSEAISSFITMSLDYAQKHKDFVLLQRIGYEFESGVDIKKKFFKRQRNLIKNIIRQGTQSGVFRNINVQETAKIIFSVIRGFCLSILADPDSLFSPHECSELVLNGLMKRDKKWTGRDRV
jgi:AcrR family transcriptional regulator